jgi:hypothetical protein
MANNNHNSIPQRIKSGNGPNAAPSADSVPNVVPAILTNADAAIAALDAAIAAPKPRKLTSAELIDLIRDKILAAHAAGYNAQEISDIVSVIGYRGISVRAINSVCATRQRKSNAAKAAIATVTPAKPKRTRKTKAVEESSQKTVWAFPEDEPDADEITW